MGLFTSVVDYAKISMAQSSARKDITGQVLATFNVALEGIRTKDVEIPEFFAEMPGVAAGQLAEEQLLGSVDLIIDQLQADGRRAMPAEVRKEVIEAIKDLKIKSLEQDGVVNPIDSLTIKAQANGLKQKARTHFMQIRMLKRDLDPGSALDLVELKLLEEAVRDFGRDYKRFQRAAQAAILAVTELRLQQLAGIVGR